MNNDNLENKNKVEEVQKEESTLKEFLTPKNICIAAGILSIIIGIIILVVIMALYSY